MRHFLLTALILTRRGMKSLVRAMRKALAYTAITAMEFRMFVHLCNYYYLLLLVLLLLFFCPPPDIPHVSGHWPSVVNQQLLCIRPRKEDKFDFNTVMIV